MLFVMMLIMGLGMAIVPIMVVFGPTPPKVVQQEWRHGAYGDKRLALHVERRKWYAPWKKERVIYEFRRELGQWRYEESGAFVPGHGVRITSRYLDELLWRAKKKWQQERRSV